MNFSQQIKQSNTDEWYTPVEPVRMIIPYLHRGGIREYFAHSTSPKVILTKC